MDTSIQLTLPRGSRACAEQGIALILAMFVTIIAVGVAVSGSSLMKAFRTEADTAFVTTGQASQFARSGLTEALNWFRLQSSQPVVAFAPVRDELAVPKILETDDPDIGLVRNFEVSGLLWGRYEVWKRWDADPDPDRLAWRQKMQVEDVSALRNDPKTGSVWRITCVGYVFRRVDPNKAYDEYPNQVLGVEVLETEIRRLNLIPPGAGALAVRDGGDAILQGNGQVLGGKNGAGIVYGTGTAPTGAITGTPASSPIPGYDDSTEAVFGVTVEELRAMANSAITKNIDFPTPVPQNAIVYSAVPLMTLDNSQPLTGFGVVYHVGDLVLAPANNSNFSGLLYVDGNLTVYAPSEIKGTVIVHQPRRASQQSNVLRRHDPRSRPQSGQLGQARFGAGEPLPRASGLHLRRLPSRQRRREQSLRRLPLVGLHVLSHALRPRRTQSEHRPEYQEE